MLRPASPRTPGRPGPGPHYAFENGLRLDAGRFRPATFYVVDGLLTEDRPRRIDRTIDLTGGFVIPPFGEAHNHNLDTYSGESNVRRYLAEGIFYVKNPNAVPRLHYRRDGVNHPTSVDLSSAAGGLTANGGHALGLYRRHLARGVFEETDGEGAFFFILDGPSDLERKWESIRALNTGFIKTYLLYSEEFALRRDDDAYFGWRGLDPSLLPAIVRRAHRDRLRVSTHVESATDFHHAVAAGVDEINHLPGFRPERDQDPAAMPIDRYEIASEDARRAGRGSPS